MKIYTHQTLIESYCRLSKDYIVYIRNTHTEENCNLIIKDIIHDEYPTAEADYIINTICSNKEAHFIFDRLSLAYKLFSTLCNQITMQVFLFTPEDGLMDSINWKGY